MKIEFVKLEEKIGEKIELLGWVHSLREHKSVLFLDLRDRSALVQVVIADEKIIKNLPALNSEDLLRIEGTIQKRPAKLVNPKIATGQIEVLASRVEVLSPAETLPFEVDKDTLKVNELLRLEHRYLDLRSERMKNNLKKRHEANLLLRNYLALQGFWEVETPCLTKGTPEGAREFIVPSRLHPGNFYVLPQSPQQFKQLLMVGGVEKYFQLARCFRDEDQRGDRQPEFMQLDLEMSFAEEEDILGLVEEMMRELVKTNFPEKKILEKPFPRLTHQEALEKYKSDKPDLRKNKDPQLLAFCWVTEFPLFERSESEGKIVSCHHPFTQPKEEDMDLLSKEPLKVRARAYDLVLNGYEIGGGSLRIFKKDLQKKIFEILGLSSEEITERFGHLLRAFDFSPPPHGGIALGLDRLLALLQGEENIREVIAFPKTGDARDPLCGSPAPVSSLALQEAHIRLEKREK